MAGRTPVEPGKTVSRAMTLRSTLGRPCIFCPRLVVVRRIAGPDVLAGDMPPDRFGDPGERGIDLRRAPNRLIVVCRDTPLPAAGVKR
jgi:hypothetical protein